MGGCAGCSTKTSVGLPGGCKNNGSCATGGCGDKLDVHDWLANIYYHEEVQRHPIVEVKFKGTRKEFYRNANGLELEIGDTVVVESATTGWDIGYVSVAGELIRYQLKKYKVSENADLRRVMRKATEYDLAKYDEGKNLEYPTMLKARRLAVELGLSMKLSDVEYQ
jgi:cell fate regulator YaaT (PSP1 superfamily)